MTPVIDTSSLKIGYLQNVVHNALDLQLYAGELTSLLGINGAGKSTLIRTICGFQPPLGGEIRINGRLLNDYSQSELSQVIGVVLTDRIFAGGITVTELVSLGRYPYTNFFGHLTTNDKKIITESIESVGMASKSGNYISELSDGEKQKVMIAKVLAQQCPVIILDEPTAYLDVTNRIETMSLLHRLAGEQGKAVLLSTHDLDLAIRMSDCLWLQEKGRPMICGAPEDLILNGSFAGFFDKKGIIFDPATGKLTAEKPSRPISVTGDSNTSYWVGNALIRNRFNPSSEEESDIRIHCFSPDKISLSVPGAEDKTASSVAELIKFLISAG